MNLSEFIDIHTHILPRLDDGPKNLSASLALAEHYTSVGIKYVFATPHYLPGTAWSASSEKILATLDKLQKVLCNSGSLLEIIPGMEIAIQRNMGKNLDNDRYIPLGNSGTYLLEPPFDSSGYDPLEPVNEFIKRGHRVILAHPERSEYFQRYPEALKKAHSQDVAVQVNLGSLLGSFGQGPRKTASQFMKWDIVDFLASDAHSASQRRPPNHSEWQDLQELINPEKLKEIASINPKRLINL